MEKDFNLEQYLNSSVKSIVKDAVKTAQWNMKESFFMAKYAMSSIKATATREKAAAIGLHVPPFLIASITYRCNLNCAGCYSHAVNKNINTQQEQLSANEWGKYSAKQQ